MVFIIGPLLLFLHRRAKRRRAASTQLQRIDRDSWIGSRLVEYKAPSPAAAGTRSTNESLGIGVASADARQAELGGIYTHAGQWSTSSLGHNTLFTGSPPNSSTQLVFPSHQIAEYWEVPSPAIPTIQVTSPEVERNHRPPSSNSLADAYIPLETPIERTSNRPFVNYDSVSSLGNPRTETQLEGSYNPFLALSARRDTMSSSVSGASFYSSGEILGYGAVHGNTTTVSHQMAISPSKADVFTPSSPVDIVDRFWDLQEVSLGRTPSEYTSQSGPSSTGRLRALSPGPISRILE